MEDYSEYIKQQAGLVDNNKDDGDYSDYIKSQVKESPVADDTAIRDWLKSFYTGSDPNKNEFDQHLSVQKHINEIPITPEIRERYERQKNAPQNIGPRELTAGEAIANSFIPSAAGIHNIGGQAYKIAGLIAGLVSDKAGKKLSDYGVSAQEEAERMRNAAKQYAGGKVGEFAQDLNSAGSDLALSLPFLKLLGLAGWGGLSSASDVKSAGGSDKDAVIAGVSGAAQGALTEKSMGALGNLSGKVLPRAVGAGTGAGLAAMEGGSLKDILQEGLMWGYLTKGGGNLTGKEVGKYNFKPLPAEKPIIRKDKAAELAELQKRAEIEFGERKPTKLEEAPGPTVVSPTGESNVSRPHVSTGESVKKEVSGGISVAKPREPWEMGRQELKKTNPIPSANDGVYVFRQVSGGELKNVLSGKTDTGAFWGSYVDPPPTRGEFILVSETTGGNVRWAGLPARKFLETLPAGGKNPEFVRPPTVKDHRFHQLKERNRGEIIKILDAETGKDITPEVLKDYPDLVKAEPVSGKPQGPNMGGEKPKPKIEITTGKELAEQLPPEFGEGKVAAKVEGGKSAEEGAVAAGTGRSVEARVDKFGNILESGREGDVGRAKLNAANGEKLYVLNPQDGKWYDKTVGMGTEISDQALIKSLNESVRPSGEAAPKEITIGDTFGEQFKTGKFAPKQEPKISQVVNVEPTKFKPRTVGTFTKEFGKENALKLSEGFAEYQPSIRKEQKVRAAEELLRDGLEKSSQDLINKKDTWDDYDLMKANEIRRTFQKNAQKPEDLESPTLKAIMKRSKEHLSKAGQDLQTAAEVDFINDPVRAAEVKINEQIKKNPRYRDKQEKAKNVLRKIDERFYEINKSILSRFDKDFVVNVSKLLGEQIKIDGVKLNELIRRHYIEVDATGKTLAQKITEQMPLSEAEARTISDYVRNGFEVLTNSRKVKALEGLLGKTKTKPGETDVIKKIVELSNMGAMDNAQYADIVAKKVGVPSLTPEHMFRISKQAQKIQEMPEGSRAEREAVIDEVGKLYADLYADAPKTPLQKAMDIRVLSMLYNFKSAERNVMGQGGDTVVTSIAKDVFGVPADIFMTKMLKRGTGMPTERTMDRTQWKTMIESGIRGARRGLSDVKKNIYTTAIKIEKDLGVKLPKDSEKFGMGRPEWKSGGVAEKIQRGVGYLLQAPDAAFQEGVFWESYRNQLNALSPSVRSNLPQAIKQKMATQAWREASTVTYRKMNKFSTAIVDLQRRAGTIGKLILTFPKVASNLLYSGLYEYGPIGLGVTANRMRKFIKSGGMEIEPAKTRDKAINQRQLAFDFARGAMGTTIVALGALAGYTSAVTGGRDEDANVQKTEETLGKQPGAVRIGKHYYRYDWAQPIAIPWELGVEIGKKLRGGSDAGFAENVLNVLIAAATNIVDQPLFTTFNRVLGGGGQKGGARILGAAEALISSSASSFIPTLSGQARQLVDRYQRNIFRQYGKGQVNTLKAWGFNAAAMILNKIPFASKLLEKRKDIFGNNMEYHQSGNLLFDALDRFANPSITTNAKRDPGIEFILKLNEDKPKDMTEKPLPKITEHTWYIERNKKRYYMTPAQRAKYQELVGKDAYDFISQYYKYNKNSGAPTEDMIKEIYRELGDIGKRRREEMLEELGAD